MTHSGTQKRLSVAVIGGGLAGIASAAACAQPNVAVTVFESRQSLGGRATSYVDAESGEQIDNCQHVSMGCCTCLKELSRVLGLDTAFQTEQTLYFIGPDGSCTPFQAGAWPAPLHLAKAFRRLPWLTWGDKISFARAVSRLAKTPRIELKGICFADWLKSQGQSDRLIRNLWEVVLVSALSESLDRVDAAYAQKVFVDGFLNHAEGWKVEIPKLSLDELYSERTEKSLNQMGVEVCKESRVASFVANAGRVEAIVLKDGREFKADEYILAVPQHQLGPLLGEIPALQPLCEQAGRIESAPITSAHLWFDRPVMDLPHAVLIDRLGQWVFARGPRHSADGVRYLYQVVISASRQLKGLPQEDVIDQICGELRSIWPAAGQASLIHSRLITERRAVFSAVPGIDHLRPVQQTALSNLALAGDWTQTGWPATMEGAVRSGFLAARHIQAKHQLPDFPWPADLPRSWLSRLLWGSPTNALSGH